MPWIQRRFSWTAVEIRAWMNNCMPQELRTVIIYPRPNMGSIVSENIIYIFRTHILTVLYIYIYKFAWLFRIILPVLVAETYINHSILIFSILNENMLWVPEILSIISREIVIMFSFVSLWFYWHFSWIPSLCLPILCRVTWLTLGLSIVQVK